MPWIEAGGRPRWIDAKVPSGEGSIAAQAPDLYKGPRAPYAPAAPAPATTGTKLIGAAPAG